MSQEKPILDYASPPIVAKVEFPTFVRRIVLLLILPALALPFVEHIESSPLDDVINDFHWAKYYADNLVFCIILCISAIMRALFFFAGIVAALCYLRVRISGELSKVEIWVGYVVAGLGMASVMWTLFRAVDFIRIVFEAYGYERALTVQHLGEWIVPAVVLAFGTFVVWSLGKRISHATRICACLCIPYAAHLANWEWVITVTPCYWQYWGIFDVLALSVIVGCLIELTTLAVLAFRRGHAKA
ncbi:MAG: hypothetical protein FWD53_08255 [Phycisphaerales bacterium]|nr:hypothetical protein [Phycisphaerales bacterium]